MVVYLDTLILDNFCADAALLYCAVKTVKGEAKFWRIFLTALFGTVLGVGYTIFKLYYTIPAAVDVFAKYGVAALLPLPAARFKKKRTYLLCSLAFVGYMFALAGMLTALFAQISPNRGEGELTYTLWRIPSGMLAAGCVLVTVFGIRIAKMLKNHGKTAAYVCTCRLLLGGNCVTAKAFIDTGNRLKDGRGMPVAVAERALVLALLAGRQGKEKAPEGLPGLFTGSTACEKLAVETVNGKSELTAFRIDELQIYFPKGTNILKDVTVAVSPRPLAGEYAIILPAAFAKEEDFEDRGG